ncbi:MAG TPA: hypothetical protein VNI54_06410 [Thermoanaerobaculia bacterium]|nr:hypothetical protein [Thermoanaerobaculia bacterium]
MADDLGEFKTPLRIVFHGEFIPCNVLVRVAAAVESAAVRVERDEIEILRLQLPDIPAVAPDAARFRMEAYTGSAVMLQSSAPGSIILIGMVAGLSYWILDKTLGETISESWKNSPGHQRLLDFFSRRRRLRGERVASEVESAAAEQLRDGNWPVRVRAEYDGRGIEIEVFVQRVDIPIY